jgi:hypothetical protein
MRRSVTPRSIASPSPLSQLAALDREKLKRYHELFEELGGYAYDRDPGRPGWYSTVPNRDWADPSQSVTPRLRTEAVAIDVKRKGRAS